MTMQRPWPLLSFQTLSLTSHISYILYIIILVCVPLAVRSLVCLKIWHLQFQWKKTFSQGNWPMKTHIICQTSQELSHDKEKAREGDSQRCWCFYHGDRGQVSWQWEHVETKYGLFPEAYSWNNTWTTQQRLVKRSSGWWKTIWSWNYQHLASPTLSGPLNRSLLFSKSWGEKNMQNVSPSLSCGLFEQFCPPRNIPCRAAMLGSQRACSPVLSSAGQCPSFGTIGIPQCKIAETGRNITPRANGCL